MMDEQDARHGEANPLQHVDQLYGKLVAHYGDAEDREIRAASKLLLVALEKFQCHGGDGWVALVAEYIALLDENPNKFKRIMNCQRYPGRPQASP